MNISICIKSQLSKAYYSSGLVSKIIKRSSLNSYLILMYHRVIPYKEAEPGLQAGMYVDPKTFERHIQYLKEYFHVIPMAEIADHLENSSFVSNGKPLCMITFDDGWYDFYKYAYPILVEQRMPVTIFLPTKFVGTKNWFWTDQLTKLFVEKKQEKRRMNMDAISGCDMVKKLSGLKGSTDTRIENAISMLKNYREENIYKIISKLKKLWGIDPEMEGRAFLDWEEVRKMAESGLVTFGSHTENHKILVHLKEKEILEELIQSKYRLISEGVVNPSFIPFCYPNGNYSDTVIRNVKESGYHIAVTTEKGWNDVNTPLFKQKRIAIHQDMASTKEFFLCRIANLL